jgi:hypothetical protein
VCICNVARNTLRTKWVLIKEVKEEHVAFCSRAAQDSH